MEIDLRDVRINHFYLGPGNGSSIEAVYVPTGASVTEHIPSTSSENGHAIQFRLLLALKLKIREEGKSGKV